MRIGFRRKMAYLLFCDMCVQCVLVTVTSLTPFPFLSNPFFFQGSSPTIFTSCLSFCFWWHIAFTWGCLQAQGITAGRGSWGQWLCQAQEKAFYSTPAHHPALPFCLPPLCCVSRSEEAIDVPFRADHSTVTYPYDFDSVRVFVLTTANRSVFNQGRAWY